MHNKCTRNEKMIPIIEIARAGPIRTIVIEAQDSSHSYAVLLHVCLSIVQTILTQQLSRQIGFW